MVTIKLFTYIKQLLPSYFNGRLITLQSYKTDLYRVFYRL